MAHLYERKSRPVWEPVEYFLSDRTLVELLTTGNWLAIEGVVMLQKGSPEWQQYLDKECQKLRGRENCPLSEKDIQEFRDYHSKSDYLPAVNTPFTAVAWTRDETRRMMFDGGPGHEIIVAEKQIVIRPSLIVNNNSIGDAILKARICHLSYYDGRLEDALAEFQNAGYQLIQA